MIVNFMLLNFIYLFFFILEWDVIWTYFSGICLYTIIDQIFSENETTEICGRFIKYWHSSEMLSCLSSHSLLISTVSLPSLMTIFIFMQKSMSPAEMFHSYLYIFLQCKIFAYCFVSIGGCCQTFPCCNWEFSVHSTDACNAQRDTRGNPCVCLITANQIGLFSQSSKRDVLLKYVGFPRPPAATRPHVINVGCVSGHHLFLSKQ